VTRKQHRWFKFLFKVNIKKYAYRSLKRPRIEPQQQLNLENRKKKQTELIDLLKQCVPYNNAEVLEAVSCTAAYQGRLQLLLSAWFHYCPQAIGHVF
jgi:hypothetical protein